MSKRVTVAVEDTDVVEAFVRLLPPCWDQQGESIRAHLLITVNKPDLNKKTDIRVLEVGSGRKNIATFQASSELFDDLIKRPRVDDKPDRGAA